MSCRSRISSRDHSQINMRSAAIPSTVFYPRRTVPPPAFTLTLYPLYRNPSVLHTVGLFFAETIPHLAQVQRLSHRLACFAQGFMPCFRDVSRGVLAMDATEPRRALSKTWLALHEQGYLDAKIGYLCLEMQVNFERVVARSSSGWQAPLVQWLLYSWRCTCNR